MPDTVQEVTSAYQSAVASLQEILENFDSSAAERRAAEQSIKDLATALGMYSIKKVKERTALLNAMIVELEKVVTAASAGSKIQSTIDKVSGHVTTAQNMLAKAKGELANS